MVIAVIDGPVVIAVDRVARVRHLAQGAAAEVKQVAVLDERELDEAEPLLVGPNLQRG